jgi:hypothetical protein
MMMYNIGMENKSIGGIQMNNVLDGVRPDAIQWAFWDEVLVLEEDAVRLKPIRIEVNDELDALSV